MLDHGKIQSSQLACMIYLSTLATSMILAAQFAYIQAKTDMWLSPALASVTAFYLIAILFYMHRLFPGRSLVQYSEELLGVYAGKAVGFIILLVMLLMNANQTRLFGEVMSAYFFRETPPLVINLSLILVCAIAVRSGIEVVGRLAQLCTPIIVILMLIFFLPFLSEIEFDRLLPMLQQGIVPVLRSSVYLQVWFPMYIFMTFFLPYVSDIGKARKHGFIAVCATTASLTGMMLLVLLILDQSTSLFSHPFMILARYVEAFDFIEQFDVFLMIFWVLDVLIRTTVILSATCLAVAQWLRLSAYKPLAFPLSSLTLAISGWGTPRVMDYNQSGNYIMFIYIIGFLLIPTLLFLVSLFRKPHSATSDSAQATADSG
ncbi:GerAB/ArcD/ProY family transporter [Paenibacillus sp. YIM B09110]|uniref:GerAB/ArcD/ProY family transporter n=1 Tax=Paenibacillus sp. YIM B09110 TaxID=3126102 RepID=UPI00301CFA56